MHPEPEGHEDGEGAWAGVFGRPPGGADDDEVEVEVEVADEWAAEEVADFFGLGSIRRFAPVRLSGLGAITRRPVFSESTNKMFIFMYIYRDCSGNASR